MDTTVLATSQVKPVVEETVEDEPDTSKVIYSYIPIVTINQLLTIL